MQNLFYVPPAQPQTQHPKPIGVKTVIKRNAPTRLDIGPGGPSAIFGSHDGLVPVSPQRKGKLHALRAWLGQRLIALGQALTPKDPSTLGQAG